MTTSQVTRRDGEILIRLGDHDAPVPAPLGTAITDLTRAGRTHTGIGSPATSPWLFPGHLPGRPIQQGWYVAPYRLRRQDRLEVAERATSGL